MRSGVIEREVFTSSAVASSNPPPLAQVYFGGVPDFASSRGVSLQAWRMNGKIYVRDYLVYGVFGAYTESEQLGRSALRGFYYDNAPAESIEIVCSLVTGRSVDRRDDSGRASKVNLNFERIFVSPGFVGMTGSTAGSIISGGLVLTNAFAGCEHAVRVPLRTVGSGQQRAVEAITSY